MTEGDGLQRWVAPALPFAGDPAAGTVSPAKIADKALGFTLVKLNNSFGKIDKPSGLIERVLRRVPIVRGQLATFVVAAVIRELLDTSLADTLRTSGRVHLESARDTLDEVPAERTERRRREKITIAESALRDAYLFHDKEAAARERKWLTSNRSTMLAHQHAVEAAAYVACINRYVQSDAASVAKWADRAAEHFDRYAALSQKTAENGVLLTSIGKGVTLTASTLGVAVGGLGAVIAVGGGIAMLSAADERMREHEAVPETIDAQRKELDMLLVRLRAT